MFELEKLQELLADLDRNRDFLKDKIERLQKHEEFKNNPYKSHRITSLPLTIINEDAKNSAECNLYTSFVDKHKVTNFDKIYHLFTFTFAPRFVLNTDLITQTQRLENVFQLFNNVPIWACIEKHKSGILHGHLLTIIDPIEIKNLLNKIRPHLTYARATAPAIKYDIVKATKTDILNTYYYITNHKNDHPFFKKLYFHY